MPDCVCVFHYFRRILLILGIGQLISTSPYSGSSNMYVQELITCNSFFLLLDATIIVLDLVSTLLDTLAVANLVLGG
jgi:hypothetical protein